MKSLLTSFVLLGLLVTSNTVSAQIDSTLLRNTAPQDTPVKGMNMDAVYNRPFLGLGKLPVSIGGYVEANWQHLGTDGVSEGHQFQFRRMTVFMAASIHRRIKFLTEIEYEHGGREVALEFAALDFNLHPMLNLRGGMILNPIGAFNQNHDGPKWEFTDRPIMAEQMLPATWSNAGFGLYGKQYLNDWMFGYEFYLSGGFDNSIIDNSTGRTFLPAAKENPERFEEIASGQPLLTGKVAARHNKVGEIGLSYMGGIYNTYQDDGIVLDEKRRVDVFAIDANATLPKVNTYITGEWAWVFVDVPTTYSPQYGSQQQGGFVDVVQPIVKRKMLNWEDATLNLAVRLEYVDWNVGEFEDNVGSIGDEVASIMPGLSFRPVSQTAVRLNYRLQKQTDLLGNPPALTSGFSLGVSSYF